jgi:hypothetical protein
MHEQLIADLKKSNRPEARCMKILLESGITEALVKAADTAEKCNELHKDFVMAEMTFFMSALLARLDIKDKKDIIEMAEKGHTLHKVLGGVIQDLIISRVMVELSK